MRSFSLMQPPGRQRSKQRTPRATNALARFVESSVCVCVCVCVCGWNVTPSLNIISWWMHVRKVHQYKNIVQSMFFCGMSDYSSLFACVHCVLIHYLQPSSSKQPTLNTMPAWRNHRRYSRTTSRSPFILFHVCMTLFKKNKKTFLEYPGDPGLFAAE
jgi:hypothetical protein